MKQFLAISNDVYTVGCGVGTPSAKFTAADLDTVAERIRISRLKIKDVPQEEISDRFAAAKSTGSQGYVKCE
ncbi:hypothetical protein T11_15532 [Trichinella zimbabwensis]|uniref:Uncharacterized protein n=1 Tax=Trichinella zimbabwensis TaxID=268475 RepID=A0A0V1H573_9BILA|nr:hypothetical protein T11_15532 [Trichinella zimbabwensis]